MKLYTHLLAFCLLISGVAYAEELPLTQSELYWVRQAAKTTKMESCFNCENLHAKDEATIIFCNNACDKKTKPINSKEVF